MKALVFRFMLFLTLSSFFYLQSASAAIAPQSCTSLYKHLVEVNANWLSIDKNANPYLLEQVSFENEAKRIQNHLVHVIEYLQKEQDQINEKRTTLLKALNGYAQKAQFPINTFHENRTPYFVDLNNTHCAVGYMMKANGDLSLIDQIAENYNNFYIEDMPQLALSKWAASNGFTKEELKWIQPGYPPARQQYFAMGSNGGANGAIHCMAKDENDEMLYIGGAFSEIDDQGANGIIAWDGASWHSLANGLDGVVNDIFVKDQSVYVVGDFTFIGEDEIINIASWNGQEWEALQTGDMGGNINALAVIDGEVFIGGNFSMVNGEPADNIARFNTYHDKWYNHALAGQETIENGFGVNGEVVDFAINANNYLLVVGDFTETAPSVASPSPINEQVNKLCYWNRFENTWNFSSNFPGENIGTAFIADNALYTASSIFDENMMYINKAGVWKTLSEQNFGASYLIEGDGLVHEMIEHNDEIYILNGFGNYVIVGTQGSGISKLFDENACFISPVSSFDKPVRTGISFQGHLYFGGDFTQTYGVDENGSTTSISLNNLGFSRFDGLASATSSIDVREKIQIHQKGTNLNIQWNDLGTNAMFHLVNLEGKQVHSCMLSNSNGNKTVPIGHLPSGVYFYQTTDGTLQKSEKIYINRL